MWQLVCRANSAPWLWLGLLSPGKYHVLALNSRFGRNKQGWILAHCLLKNIQLTSGYGGVLGGRGYSSSDAYLELNTINTIPNTKK